PGNPGVLQEDLGHAREGRSGADRQVRRGSAAGRAQALLRDGGQVEEGDAESARREHKHGRQETLLRSGSDGLGGRRQTPGRAAQAHSRREMSPGSLAEGAGRPRDRAGSPIVLREGTSMKERYIRAMDAIHNACLFVAGAFLVIIVLIIPYGVFTRYVLN